MTIGIDVVDIERLRTALDRCPPLEARLFTETERAYCRARSDPVRSFAGNLAAKEAAIKALRLGPLASWTRRIVLHHAPRGRPWLTVAGKEVTGVSISHDGGVAVATVLVEGAERASADVSQE